MTDDATLALRATSHPVRLQILSLLTGSALTAQELADELDLSRADVVLAGPGGDGETRYLYPWDRERRVAGDAQTRQAWIRAMASELVRRVMRSSDTRGHFADAELWVTPEQYAEVRRRMRECSAALHDAAQPPRSEGTVKVSLTTALFEMAGEDEPVTGVGRTT